MKKVASVFNSYFLAFCLGFVVCYEAEIGATELKQSQNVQVCPQKFTDQQIDQILTEKLPLNYDHRITVHYSNCSYGVVIWPTNGPPDSQTLIKLDRDGNLPPIVVKFGINSQMTKEGASYRELSVLPYPPHALEEGIAGKVLVRVSISSDGTVGNARIVQVIPREAVELTEGLIGAIRKWRFNPLTLYGNAVSSDVIVPVHFTIKGQQSLPSWRLEYVAPDDDSVLETIEARGDPDR